MPTIDKTSKLHFKIKDVSYLIFQKQVLLDIDDALSFLESANLYPKIYWKSKNQKETTLALGSLLEFDELPNIDSTDEHSCPKFFGMTPFPSSQKKALDPWKGFPKKLFYLPKIVIKLQEGKTIATFYSLDEGETLALETKQLSFRSDKPSLIKEMIYHPSFQDYEQKIKTLFKFFDTSSLEKVVFSRTCELTLNKAISPYHLLEKLIKTSNNCHLFGFFPKNGTGFIGATPENLYVREGHNVSTHALAGTRARSSNLAKDQLLAKELLNSLKDRKEFDHVASFIKERLILLSESFSESDVHILSSATTHHLNQTFCSHLKDFVSDQELINALHPTPAMSGLPQDEAIKIIDQLETYNRGFYSAPIGWFSKDFSEVIIGIRSCLISNNKIYLFSGGGIISDSKIEDEWEELNLKISPIRNLL